MAIPGISKKYSDTLIDSDVVENLEMDTTVIYNSYKGKMMVSGRDFCMVTQVYVEDDGTIIYGTSSIEHPKCPPVKKFVRADLIIGGWIFTPKGD